MKSPRLAHRLAHAGQDWIVPDWDVPPSVRALSTTRNGGVSAGALATLNLGAAKRASDADYSAVIENRRRLTQFLPSAPVWLFQVHGKDVAPIETANLAGFTMSPPTADAAVTRTPGIVLGVRTA